MANRLILVMLLLATTTAHAQIAGAGGAPFDATAKPTQRQPTVLLPRRTDSPPLSKTKITRRVVSRSALPRIRPQPTTQRPQTVMKGH